MILALLLAALALSLTACGPAGEAASPSPSPSPEPAAAPEGYCLPDRDCQPWQSAYMDFLTGLVEREWADFLTYEALSGAEKLTEEAEALIAYRSNDYSLYDVDEDGVPELFMTYNGGSLERCYTFREGEVVLAGEFLYTRSQLYTCPGESAFLVYCHSNSYTALWKYPMEDGTLGPELTLFSEVFSETGPKEYVEPDEAVPGTKRIDYFPFEDGRSVPRPSADQVPLQPICDWKAHPPGGAG